MVTRTFTKETFTVKGITADDEMKTFELELWEHEKPNGKRALQKLFSDECKKRGMEFFKATLTGNFSEVRGISEAEFFKASIHVDR